MDEEEAPPGNAPQAAFPAPPPFFKHFTKENRDRLRDLRAKAEEDANGASLPTADLPPELRYLVPPAPPQDGIYLSFGESFNINGRMRSLTDDGIEQVYPSGDAQPNGTAPSEPLSTTDHPTQLISVTRSILLNFLEFTDVLSRDPSLFEPKLEDIRTLFLNAHHLVNEYRPHQARETLIEMMQDQIDRKRREMADMNEMIEKADGQLKDLEQGGDDIGDQKHSTSEREERLRTKEQQHMIDVWRALDAVES